MSGTTEVAGAQNMLARLFDAMPDIVAQFDRKLRHTYVNPAVEHATGIPRERFIGRTNRQLDMPEDLVATWDDALQNVFATGNAATLEFEYLRGDETLSMEACLVPAVDDDGRVVRVLAVTRDVTRRHLATRALEESERRVRRILESISEGFFAVDNLARFTYVNRRAEELLERDRAALIGAGLWSCFPKAIDSPFFTQFRRAAETRAPVSFDAHYPPLEKWFSVEIYPYEEGASVFFRDVTDYRRLQEEVTRVAEEERKRVAQEIHDTVGGTLTGIAMMAKSLEHAIGKGVVPDAEPVEEIVRRAAEGVETTRRLAHGLYPHLSEEEGLLEGIRRLAEQVETSGTACDVEVKGSVPALDASKTQHLYRICQEALQNAMRHAEAEKITIPEL